MEFQHHAKLKSLMAYLNYIKLASKYLITKSIKEPQKGVLFSMPDNSRFNNCTTYGIIRP